MPRGEPVTRILSILLRVLCILILWCSAAPAASILFNITTLHSSATATNMGVALPNTGAISQKFVLESAGITSDAVPPDTAAVPATGLNQGQAVGKATINGVDSPGEFSGDSTADPSNELGASTLTGINNSGQIVGYGANGAAIKSSGGGSTTHPSNSTLTQIVGYGANGTAIKSGGGVTSLGAGVGGKQVASINSSNQIGGWELGPATSSSTCQSGYRAFSYSGTCGNSYGITINNKGQVTLDNGVLNSLPTLGGTVNNKAQVVSSASNSGGTLITLNNVEPSPPSSGVVIESTTGINDQGQIVGNGIYGGGLEGFLQPTVDPPALPEPRMTWGVLLAGCCGVFILRRKSGKRLV